MNHNIRKNILAQSDEKLIEIITNQAEYTIEAVTIAKEEVNRRNFDEVYLQKIKEKINIKKREEEDLTNKEKVILLFSFYYIIIIFLALDNFFPKLPSAYEYYLQGKIRKSKKTMLYKIFSTIFWLIILLICWLIYDSYSAHQRYREFIESHPLTTVILPLNSINDKHVYFNSKL